MGDPPRGGDRATRAIAGGGFGLLVGGILVAIMYGGKGLEGYAVNIPVISMFLLSIGGAGTLLGLVTTPIRRERAESQDNVASQSLATLLLLVAAFCGYGFLASFEPGPHLAFRIGYPVLGALCLGSAGWLVRKQ